MEKLFPDQSEPVTRDLTAYTEDREKLLMEKNDQRTRTCLLAKYGGLSLYDIDFEKRYSIDYEDIHFVKGYGYALTVYPYHPDGTSTDHEYFSFMLTCLTEF